MNQRNINWTFTPNTAGTYTTNQVMAMTLLDIRDELQRLNSLLHCRNFIQIPQKLDVIRRNTTKKKIKK